MGLVRVQGCEFTHAPPWRSYNPPPPAHFKPPPVYDVPCLSARPPARLPAPMQAERIQAAAARWRKNSKPSMALQMDDVESESSEDDWEIGMAQETSLHFLKVVPKAYVEEDDDEGIPTQRIPTHRSPELIEPLRVVQPGPTGWPEERPAQQGAVIGLRSFWSLAAPARCHVSVPMFLAESCSDHPKLSHRPI